MIRDWMVSTGTPQEIDIDYSNDCNILMPVVDKIRSEVQVTINSNGNGWRCVFFRPPCLIDNWDEAMIGAIYKSVIAFILWHNEQTKS